MNLKKNAVIIIIICIFFFSNILLILLRPEMWWDPAVYVGMGKYIFSFGNSGLWEPSRPLVLPIFLGFLWELGLVAFTQRFFCVLFGAAIIYLVYLIGKESFNEKIALLSAIFLGFSPTFFFHNSMILTDIASTFFALISIYAFLKKRYFLTGLFSGLAFMTRFLQLWVFIVLVIVLFLNYKKEKNILWYFFTATNGFLIIFVPYLIFNYFKYKSILYPFFLQTYMTNYTGWIWHKPLWFYPIGLFKESFISIFAIIGLFYFFKRVEDKKTIFVLLLALFFIFFSSINHKEMRFTIVFLPYLYLISSYGIMETLKSIKSIKAPYVIIAVLVSALFIQYGNQIIPQYRQGMESEDKFSAFQNYLERQEVKTGIWISNPVFAVYSDKKIDELMYYPTFNHDKFLDLKKRLNSAQHILVNTCDLYCEKYNYFCLGDKVVLVDTIKHNFKEVYYKQEGECEELIFSLN